MLPTRPGRFVPAALLALAVLPVLSAPAGAQAGEEPPLSAFVDSAGLVRAVAALPAPSLPPGMEPIFLVSFDSTGGLEQVQPFGQLPASDAEPVAAAIRANLRPQAPSRQPIATYLRVLAGPEPRVDRPALRVESPRLTNRSALASAMQQVIARFASRQASGTQPSYEVELRFRVLEDGTVDTLSTTVSRSTGNAELDREAMSIVRAARFRPATAAGHRIKETVTLPLVLTMPPGSLAVSSMVDPAALAGALAGLSMPELPAGIRPLFRVDFDSTGAVEQVEPVFEQIPAGYAEAVVAALRTSARRQAPPPPGRRLPTLYLLVAAGAEPVVSRLTVVEEQPELLNQREVDGMVNQARRRLGRRPEPAVVFTGVEMRVRADGTVDPESIRVRMPGPEPSLDSEALGIAARMRFRPATVDGMATPMRIMYPIFFWRFGQ